MNDLIGRRKSKQPLEYPSAGSTFKRPVDNFAGKLIQDSGFVINKGEATCNDVITLVNKVKETVFEKTGVELECEIRIIPYK